MPITVSCAQCGALLDRAPWTTKRNKHHYCGRKCRALYLSQHITGANHHQWTSTDIPCASCGTIVQRTPSQTATRGHAFCTRKCYFAYLSMHKTGDHNPNWNGGSVDVLCAQCGTALQRNPSQADAYAHQFCNKACHGEYLAQHITGANHHLWQGGRIGYYGPNWQTQQRAARRRDGYKCRHCGVKPKGRALDVHHIKPFRSFGYIPDQNENYLMANDLINLVSLCKRCHKLAELGIISVL
jgi:5-methylcytosine-specific restriction endonuclease McrA